LINDFASWVGIGLAGLANIFDPEVIVVGGGVMNASEVLMPQIAESFADHLYASAIRELPRIVVAQLGENAAAIGSALLGADATIV
jgi:glucokinase